MLSEPKRKTVWSLNPRGKYWSEDKTKFGQKLLESMGWEEGLGLGKEGNGIREHIKVSVNSDNKGLGYKPSADGVWIDKNNDFEDLLATLAIHHNNGSKRSAKVSNLEEMSKRMRNRVHYTKLIKAKNLSQCSEKDLISIFPKKRNNCENEKNISVETNGRESAIHANTCDNTFESSKNMNEYFRSKMDKLKIKSQLFNKINSPKVEESVEIIETINGENCVLTENLSQTKDNNEINDNLDGIESKIDIELNDSIECKSKKSKKNKRKKEEKLENNLVENELNIEIVDHLSEQTFTKANKSKKSRKSKKVEIECNDSIECNVETQSDRSSETNSEPKESAEKASQLLKTKKPNKRVEKNIEKYKIRVPLGYNKQSVSVNDSLKNYHKICSAISRDRTLNTSNLMALKGYGCGSD